MPGIEGCTCDLGDQGYVDLWLVSRLPFISSSSLSTAALAFTFPLLIFDGDLIPANSVVQNRLTFLNLMLKIRQFEQSAIKAN